ncbi:MAG: GWxTD domain-containing protein [Bacteroidetes bacterium]|nr:GWxTD domain-containing protein [Bacteroidota bacterium]
MTLNIIKLISAAALLVLLSSCASEDAARDRQDNFGIRKFTMREGTFGKKAYLGLTNIQSSDSAFTVYASYRIRYDTFIFSREIDSAQTTFSASGEVTIEILDSLHHTVVTRSIEKVHLTAGDNSASSLKKNFYQGISVFSLPKGKYIALMRIEDNSAAGKLPDIREPFILEKKNNFLLSSLLWISNSPDSNRYHALNLGNDIFFSQPAQLCFAALEYLRSNSLTMTLYKKDAENETRNLLFRDSTLQASIIPSSIFLMKKNSSGIDVLPQPHAGVDMYLLPLQTEKLAQGVYQLELTLRDSIRSSLLFSTQWLDMPLSLTSLELSLEVLRYITTKEEFSELNSGSRNNKIQRLNDFWKKKDPTPNTAYNEVMTEFYKRVDYAAETFITFNGENGALTDRGKIYILYGAPNSIKRLLTPNSYSREVWSYTKLDKTFTFEDHNKQGNYQLIAN